ncbi:MAG: ferredoxin family protein [Phycisphaerae bacterium]
MPHVITNRCVGTRETACVAVCPVDCIHPTGEEAAFADTDMLYIDPDNCIDCGLCVDECPVSAIFLEDELPQEYTPYIRINSAFFEKKRH